MVITTHPKIIYLGTPAFAAIVLEILAKSSFVPALVVTEPDKPVGRQQLLTPPATKVAARNLCIPVTQPASHTELFEILQVYQPDLLIAVAYGRILREPVLNLPKYGALNLHASLLPRYRGASPIQAALLAGERETGVTLMQIDEGLDTGPILSTTTLAIDPAETTPILSAKLAQASGELLVQSLPGYLDGTLAPHSQPEENASVTNLLTKESGHLTGHESPVLIERMIRAYHPWPGVWLEIGDQRIILHKVQVSGDTLLIDQLQLAGKNPVDWPTFQRGHPELVQKLQELLPISR